MCLRPLRRRGCKAPSEDKGLVGCWPDNIREVGCFRKEEAQHEKLWGFAFSSFFYKDKTFGQPTWPLCLSAYSFLLLSFPFQPSPTQPWSASSSYPCWVWLRYRYRSVSYSWSWRLVSRSQILGVVGIWGLFAFSALISLHATASITEHNCKHLWLLNNYSLSWRIRLHGEKLRAQFTAWSYEGESRRCAHNAFIHSEKCLCNTYRIPGTVWG